MFIFDIPFKKFVLENNLTSPKKRILIVDDHPMTVDGYIHLLSAFDSQFDFEFFCANDCKTAYHAIKEQEAKNIFFDLAILDINLPAYPEQKIVTGDDLAVLIRQTHLLCKIMIISMYKEPIWVNKIIKTINPEGFVSKSDINYKTFPELCVKILNGEFYFSESVVQSQSYFVKRNMDWDENDSKILLLISQGIRTINLPKFIPMSLSAIEKRKANIKKQLALNDVNDQNLIDIAKKIGLI